VEVRWWRGAAAASTRDLGFGVGGEKWCRVTLLEGKRGAAAETGRVKIGERDRNQGNGGKAMHLFFRPSVWNRREAIGLRRMLLECSGLLSL
jgi:hypothetical protein